MSRKARIVIVNLPHHVVHRGNNKQLIFEDNQDRNVYLNYLREFSLDSQCELNLVCLMTNHVHLLITPLENDALSKCMHKVAVHYSKYFNKKYCKSGHLWEGRYYSAVIGKDSYLMAAVKYILRNPVRAGITCDFLSYPWSSASGVLQSKGFYKLEHFGVNYNSLVSCILQEQEDELINNQIRSATMKCSSLVTGTYLSP